MPRAARHSVSVSQPTNLHWPSTQASKLLLVGSVLAQSLSVAHGVLHILSVHFARGLLVMNAHSRSL
jgi:hypothetical protein